MASNDYLAIMEELLVSNRSDLGVMELDWCALSRFLPSAGEPKFGELAALAQGAHADQANQDDIRSMLENLNEQELQAAVKDLLKATVGEILRISADKIDHDRSIYDLGLDSLMGVELVLAIESRLGVQFSVVMLSENPTISKLTDKLISQLKNTQTTDAGDDEKETALIAAQVQQVVLQHSAEVNVQAIERFANDIHSGAAIQAQRMIQS